MVGVANLEAQANLWEVIGICLSLPTQGSGVRIAEDSLVEQSCLLK